MKLHCWVRFNSARNVFRFNRRHTAAAVLVNSEDLNIGRTILNY